MGMTDLAAMRSVKFARPFYRRSGSFRPVCRQVHRPSSLGNAVQTEDILEYRPNVGICIVNSQGLVFAAQRCDDHHNTWQMPQGGVDDGEEPAHAALREVTEETSISNARIVGELDRWISYDFPTKVKQKLGKGWKRFKGQRQKWYLAHFYGEDDEINLLTQEQEFSQWKWMKLEDMPGSVVDFKKDVYQQVAEEFVPLIQTLKDSGELSIRG